MNAVRHRAEEDVCTQTPWIGRRPEMERHGDFLSILLLAPGGGSPHLPASATLLESL
jgi:hypothetical protein